MKRIAIALVLVICAASMLAAEPSPLYPVLVDVIKVYSHADGFMVLYRKGAVGLAKVYIPVRWFVPGGKAVLVTDDDPGFPYMSVFYREGKFDQLRLYVKKSHTDPSWGILSPDEGRGKFDAEDLKIEF